jgi:hypothetical protein
MMLLSLSLADDCVPDFPCSKYYLSGFSDVIYSAYAFGLVDE